MPIAQRRKGDPKRVLIIHSFGRDFAPYNVVATTLRTNLTQLMRESVALHETSLDMELGGTRYRRHLFDPSGGRAQCACLISSANRRSSRSQTSHPLAWRLLRGRRRTIPMRGVRELRAWRVR